MKTQNILLMTILVLSFLLSPLLVSDVMADEDLEARADWFRSTRSNGPNTGIPASSRHNALKQLAANRSAGRLAAQEAGFSWQPIGPWPLIGEGPSGNRADFTGRVTAIAIDPSDHNTVYIGTALGGVWKTTDDGSTWNPLSDYQDSLAIGSLAIGYDSSSGTKIIYAGTGEANQVFDNYWGEGVLKSTDGGASWELLGNELFKNSAISRIIVDDDHPEIFWLSTTRACRSWVSQECSDAEPGQTFGLWQYDPIGGFQLIFDALEPGGSCEEPQMDSVTDFVVRSKTGSVIEAYIGVQHSPSSGCSPVGGIYKGTWDLNSPQTTMAATHLFWFCNDSSGGNPCAADGIRECASCSTNYHRTVNRVSLALNFDRSVLYAAQGGPSSFGDDGVSGGIYRLNLLTTPQWEKLNNPADSNTCQSEYLKSMGNTVTNVCERVDGSANSCGYTLALNVDYLDRLWIGGIGIWRGSYTDNATLSWEDVGSSVVHVDQQAIVFSDQSNHKVWLGNDGGVVSATNQYLLPSWQSKNGSENVGLQITQFYPGASSYRFEEHQALAGTQDVGVLFYDDKSGVDSWEQVEREFWWCDGNGTAFSPADPPSTWWASKAGNFLFTSTNSGLTWSEANPDQQSGKFLQPIAICIEHPEVVIQAVQSRLYRTVNGNASSIDWNFSYAPWHISALAFSPPWGSDCSNVLVAAAPTATDDSSLKRFIYNPNDPSQYPATPDIAENLECGNRRITDVAINPEEVNGAKGNQVFVSLGGFDDDPTGTNLFVSNNALTGAPNEIAWESINPGYLSLPNVPVNSILLDDFDHSTLFVGTDVGVFMGSWNEETWTWAELGGPPDGHPYSPSFDLTQDNHGTITSFTHGRGAWRLNRNPEKDLVWVDFGHDNVNAPNGGDGSGGTYSFPYDSLADALFAVHDIPAMIKIKKDYGVTSTAETFTGTNLIDQTVTIIATDGPVTIGK